MIIYTIFISINYYIEINIVIRFPDDSMVKNMSANAGDTGEVHLVPGLRRSLGGVNANHSSILAGKIPWTEEPGGL